MFCIWFGFSLFFCVVFDRLFIFFVMLMRFFLFVLWIIGMMRLFGVLVVKLMWKYCLNMRLLLLRFVLKVGNFFSVVMIVLIMNVSIVNFMFVFLCFLFSWMCSVLSLVMFVLLLFVMCGIII